MRITVSGPPGSGKTTVASMLASRLGYPLIVGGRIFRRMAEERGMTLEEFSRYAEEHHEVDRELDERLAEELRGKENVVLDSRLGGWIAHLHGIPAYKVFLTAPVEVRAIRLVGRDGGTLDEVIERVKYREESERRRYMEIYGIDFTDTSIYDLVLDTSDMGPEDVAREIARGAGLEW